MIGKHISSVKNLSLLEVKDTIKERLAVKEKGEEVSYEQNLANEYSKKFSKLSNAKQEKLLKELSEIEGISEDLALKIVDILPEDLAELRLLVPKSPEFDDAKLGKVLDLLSKYLNK